MEMVRCGVFPEVALGRRNGSLRGKTMNCQDTLQQITAYLQGNLTTKEEMELVLHVETCESCFEELELNYIMLVGLDKLDKEQSSSMDFTAMLKAHMDKTRKQYKREKRMKQCMIGGIILAFLLLTGLLLYIIFFM